MAEVKSARPLTDNDEVLDRAKDFWSQYGKTISIALGAVVLLVGGFFAYKSFIKEPAEKRAADAIFHAQQFYAQDSLE